MNRIVQLDFFRGLMLVIMMMDHLIYFPLPSLQPYTYNFTFQTFGFASAAEGFVLLSGIIFGLVYGRKYAEGGAALFNRLAARRLAVIYAHYIGTYFLIALLFSWPVFANAWPQVWESQEMIKREPWAMLARGAVFVHQTGLLDILPMYVIFIALAIPAMRLLAAGRWKLLFAVSFALWMSGQGFFGLMRPQEFIEMRTGLHLGWFEIAAWQIVFIAGLALGYWRAANPDFRPPVSKGYIAAALAVALPLFIYRHQFMLWQDAIPHAEFFDARNLGMVRLFNTAALAYLFYALARARPQWFQARFAADLGGAAIRVFCYHVLVCYALTPFRAELGDLPVALQLLIWAALVASLYLPVFLRRPAKPAPA